MLVATGLPLDAVRMDDRKRPAADDMSATRLKRQALEVNGTPAKLDDDMGRDENLDRFTKDAILRQMKEYKREKQTLEQQLAQVTKRSVFHDEHLRILDAWFLQLIDELSLLHNVDESSSDDSPPHIPSSILCMEPSKFQEHLGSRSDHIKAKLKSLFCKTPTTSPDVKKLQERLSTLLAAEKVHVAELQRAESDRASLDDRLFNATTRYMTAEKQLDRTRSTQVAKLEAQAIAQSRTDSAQVVKTELDSKEARTDINIAPEALEAVKKEAQVVADKQREHIDSLAEENRKLSGDLTTIQARLRNLSDEDYANTELFRQFKAQHADVVKRVNDLEARNAELLEESKVLNAERTEYREQIDNEFRDQDVAMQSEIAQKDADLTRIRAHRDELVADGAVRKSTVEAHKESHERFRELAEVRQSRINALESEVERLRLLQDSRPNSDAVGDEALRQQIKSLESEKASFDQELRSMETAFRKTSALASTKITELLNHEERIKIMSEEKAKADQKYFSCRKVMDARDIQFRDMQKQVGKSSEIISTLKDSENSCRMLLINAEKQLAEAKDSLQHITIQHRATQQNLGEYKSSSTRLSAQMEDLNKLLAAKEDAVQLAKKLQREAELHLEESKIQVTQLCKDVDNWKTKAAGTDTVEMVMLKKMVYCTVCDQNIKDTVLKTCKHAMCRKCVENQIKSRERRCPICASSYGATDFFPMIL